MEEAQTGQEPEAAAEAVGQVTNVIPLGGEGVNKQDPGSDQPDGSGREVPGEKPVPAPAVVQTVIGKRLGPDGWEDTAVQIAGQPDGSSVEVEGGKS